MVLFSPPSRDSVEWSDHNHPLWRYYGAIPEGMTLYKDEGQWYFAGPGYEEEVTDDAEIIYRGGRVYDITLAAYAEIRAWLATQGIFIDPDVYAGFYPGPATYLGSESYLGVPV